MSRCAPRTASTQRLSVLESADEESGSRLRDEQRRLARHPLARGGYGSDVCNRGGGEEQSGAARLTRGLDRRRHVVAVVDDVLAVLQAPDLPDQEQVGDGDVQ